MVVQPGLCRTWSETPKTGFLTTRLILFTEENLELVSELDAVGLLVNAVRTHSKSSKVVKNACLALASLVEIDGKLFHL